MIKRELRTNRLQTYLEHAKWEDTDLLKATGITPLSLSNWLSNSHGPTPRMIDLITAALNERYMQLGILNTLVRADILHEKLPDSTHRIHKPRQDAISRFWNEVDSGDPDKCWDWMGSQSCGGYGVAWDGHKKIAAHRFAWEIIHGSISDGLLCLHKCDRPPCVNPNHLYIGTHSDNLRDKLERFTPRPEPESWAFKQLPI